MKVVISGSFRKHLEGILKLKRELEERGIEVIKPDRITPINNIDNPDFIRFEGEENIHPWILEREYLDAIGKCDAHIIYNENSYLGFSAILELGASMTKGENTKIYLIERPKREFDKLLEDMEKHGVLRIGIDQLYKDFNIKEQSIDRGEEER